MAIATITYNLPEQRDEFNTAIKGINYKSALCEIDNHLRMQIKHNETLSPDAHKAYEDMRDFFYKVLTEQDILLA